jgi:hypothetical protein
MEKENRLISGETDWLAVIDKGSDTNEEEESYSSHFHSS